MATTHHLAVLDPQNRLYVGQVPSGTCLWSSTATRPTTRPDVACWFVTRQTPEAPVDGDVWFSDRLRVRVAGQWVASSGAPDPSPTPPSPPQAAVFPHPSLAAVVDLWGASPAGTPQQANVIKLQHAYMSTDGLLKLAGWTNAGEATLRAQVTAWRADGRRVYVTLSRGHTYPADVTDAQARAADIKAISDRIGGVDGVDFHTGTKGTIQQQVAFVEACRGLFGTQFVATVTPAGDTINNQWDLAAALHEKGLLANISQEFFWLDFTVAQIVGTIRGRLDQGLIPVEKIGVGVHLETVPDWAGHPEWVQTIRDETGVRAVTLHTGVGTAAQQFAATVAPMIGV